MATKTVKRAPRDISRSGSTGAAPSLSNSPFDQEFWLGQRTWRQFIRAVVVDGVAALAGTLVVTLLVASLATAGVLTMTLAIIYLIFAFGVAAFIALLLPRPIVYRLIGLGMVGVVLAAIGVYEARHYTPPVTKEDIRQAVEDGTLAHPYHDRRQCPPNSMVFMGNRADGAGNGLDVDSGVNICVVDNQMRVDGTAYHFRGK